MRMTLSGFFGSRRKKMRFSSSCTTAATGIAGSGIGRAVGDDLRVGRHARPRPGREAFCGVDDQLHRARVGARLQPERQLSGQPVVDPGLRPAGGTTVAARAVAQPAEVRLEPRRTEPQSLRVHRRKDQLPLLRPRAVRHAERLDHAALGGLHLDVTDRAPARAPARPPHPVESPVRSVSRPGCPSNAAAEESVEREVAARRPRASARFALASASSRGIDAFRSASCASSSARRVPASASCATRSWRIAVAFSASVLAASAATATSAAARLGRGLVVVELLPQLRPFRGLEAVERRPGFDPLVLLHQQIDRPGHRGAVLAPGRRQQLEPPGHAERGGDPAALDFRERDPQVLADGLREVDAVGDRRGGGGWAPGRAPRAPGFLSPSQPGKREQGDSAGRAFVIAFIVGRPSRPGGGNTSAPRERVRVRWRSWPRCAAASRSCTFAS